MKTLPTVSVILPVYNGALYLEEAINSILSQSYTDFELVIVNDGSEDTTEEIVHRFSDERIKYFKIVHAGVAHAANVALSHCSGEYVARMDADDISYPHRLSVQMKFLQDHREVDVVGSKVQFWSAIKEESQGFERYVKWTNKLSSHEEMLRHRFEDSPIVNPSTVFKKVLTQQYGGYDESGVPEDYELWLRWMHEGVVFSKVEEDLLIWKDRKERVTRTHKDYHESAFLKVKARYFRLWVESNRPRVPIYIWGHGNVMHRRVRFLEDEGITISGYIDIEHRDQENYIHYLNTEKYADALVLGFVADPVGKMKISEFLTANGMMEGVDFFHFV